MPSTFESYLQQTFPGVRITSGRRDPNSQLGRANPRSYHNKGMAWDTAPVEGVTFQQYVDRVGKDYDVLEARDEVANPSKHATGPHWHIAVGGRKPQVANGLAGLMLPGPISGYGGGTFNLDGSAATPPDGLAALLAQNAIQPNIAPIDAPQAKLPDPKRRGTANDILGSIFDAMAAFGGGQPQYWSGINQQRQLDEKLETEGRQRLAELMAQTEQKREDRDYDLNTWKLKTDYERENRPPPSDAALLQWYQSLPPEQQAAYAQMQDVRNPIAVSGPQGTYRVPRGYGQPTNAPTTQTVNGQTFYNINGEWYDNPEGR